MKKTTLILTTLTLVAFSCPPAKAWSNPFASATAYVTSYFKPAQVSVSTETALAPAKTSYTEYVVNAYRKTASFISWLVHRKCEQEKNAHVYAEQERTEAAEQARAALQNKCRAQDMMLKRNGAYMQEVQRQSDKMLQTTAQMRQTLHECRQDIAAFNNDIATGFAAINAYFQSNIPVTPTESVE